MIWQQRIQLQLTRRRQTTQQQTIQQQQVQTDRVVLVPIADRPEMWSH
jgi:hypothetical protein